MGEGVSLDAIEAEILKVLRESSGAAYNTLDSWALIARARSNDGEGDSHYGGLFMPPNTSGFELAGLRWLFDVGISERFS